MNNKKEFFFRRMLDDEFEASDLPEEFRHDPYPYGWDVFIFHKERKVHTRPLTEPEKKDRML